ncbi:MAG: hypothetical protein N3A61_01920 [Ignavibacteria bacterium]|nr:hypothetical protein [Ignavibacteria bacterium]
MYIIKYSGPFAFIKPWTAVRDSETFSQQFLTPSIIEGIEKKLFPELLNTVGIQKIIRHRLTYSGMEIQQEVTWSKGFKLKSNPYLKNRSIISRGILIQPELYLAFNNKEDSEIAFSQTICLARNEDLLFPEEFLELTEDEFDNISGFELIFSNSDEGYKVGNSRYDGNEMFGYIKVVGNPIKFQ